MYVCFFQLKLECACLFKTIALDNYFSFSDAKIVQGECRTSSLLERYAEPHPILCKDSARQCEAQE